MQYSGNIDYNCIFTIIFYDVLFFENIVKLLILNLIENVMFNVCYQTIFHKFITYSITYFIKLGLTKTKIIHYLSKLNTKITFSLLN